jgi:ubiquinone/menaquinone biosynthesis C-methylase UbiE
MDPKQNQTIDTFSRLEHAGWQKVVRAYQRSFGGLTIQTVEPLLDAVGAGPGIKLLDAAAGPGYVAAAAATRGAEVLGVDFSSSMVAATQQQHPEIKFCHGNAESLPFESASFDAVAINFGMLHFAQPDRALEEACRVLRTGGRVGFTVWSKPDKAVGFHIILDAIRTCGNINVALPEGPPFFRFSDARE